MNYKSYLEQKKSNKLQEKKTKKKGKKEELLSTTNFHYEEFLTLINQVDKEQNLLRI